MKEKPLLLQVASSGWTKLRSVNFGRYFVDDEILQSLGMHCPSLHTVIADRCGGAVTDEGIVSLARGCRRLFHVDLSRAHIGDAGMHAFAEFCPELRWLELNECRGITDEGLAAFKGRAGPPVDGTDDNHAAKKTTKTKQQQQKKQAKNSKGKETPAVHVPCPELRSMSLMYTGVTEEGVEDFKRWAKDQANIEDEIEIEFETVDGDDY